MIVRTRSSFGEGLRSGAASGSGPEPGATGPGVRARVMVAVAVAVWLAAGAVLFLGSGRSSLAAVDRACGAPAPDARFAPAPGEVRRFVIGCGTAGIDTWRDLQLVDLVYPAALALVLASALVWGLARVAPRAQVLALLPVLAAGADYGENAGAWVLISKAPEPVSWAEWLISLASGAKVVLTTASWVVLIALLATVALRRRRHQPGR